MLTTNQRQIYENLLKYTYTGETFYKVDHIWKNVTYRIFSYRLASYTDFMQPDALEGRGIMFCMDGNEPTDLVCRPPHKFFNLNENPATMNLNLSQDNISLIMEKVDGSLISTYLDHEGELQLKSKTSLSSDQVRMAWAVLNEDNNLKTLLRQATQLGNTVNLEYLGPDNRIVIGYEKATLRILNFRNRETGEYIFPNKWKAQALSICDTFSQDPFIDYYVDIKPDGFDLKSLEDATGIEGVVVVLKDGTWFKLKTPWYAALHKTKDSINSKKKLFECVVTEASDDLKAMFFDDPTAMKLINDMEALVVPKFDHAIALVENFHRDNKDLDRKSYAIKGKAELPNEVFGLAMNKYIGREVDYKEWAVKHFEWFGVRDEVIETE